MRLFLACPRVRRGLLLFCKQSTGRTDGGAATALLAAALLVGAVGERGPGSHQRHCRLLISHCISSQSDSGQPTEPVSRIRQSARSVRGFVICQTGRRLPKESHANRRHGELIYSWHLSAAFLELFIY
jgi:hypothetical protein